MNDQPPVELGRGVYDTHRASALSGVPYRTLHHWASKHLYAPSIAPDPRTRLWSWGDLLAVRAIHWFRKGSPDAKPVPMRLVREMLATIGEIGYSRERLAQLVAVSQSGELFIVDAGVNPDDRFAFVRADRSRQLAMPGVLQLVGPYGAAPNLLVPRERLRIIPGKLSGEPHVQDTRITTAVLYRLDRLGYPESDILEMYPDIAPEELNQAVELERSLHAAA
jgi:uncharacterized protein (DUF433 family)